MRSIAADASRKKIIAVAIAAIDLWRSIFANSNPEACEGSRSPLRHRLLPIADEVIE
jgi:hypothetical protein